MQFNRRPTFTASQKPRWEGSDAECFLKSDITNNNHVDTTPQQLHASRSEYQVFEVKVFRGHIHQEMKRRNFFQVFIDANLTRNKLCTKQNSKTCQDTTNCYCTLYS